MVVDLIVSRPSATRDVEVDRWERWNHAFARGDGKDDRVVVQNFDATVYALDSKRYVNPRWALQPHCRGTVEQHRGCAGGVTAIR